MAEIDIVHVPQLLSRDGGVQKDSLIKNGYYEKNPNEELVRNRPAYRKFAQVASSAAVPYGIAAYRDLDGNERLVAVNGTVLYVTAGAASQGTYTPISTGTESYIGVVLPGLVEDEVIEFGVSSTNTYGTYTTIDGFSNRRIPLVRRSTDGGTSWTTSPALMGTQSGTSLADGLWGSDTGADTSTGAWCKHREYYYYAGKFSDKYNRLYRSADKGTTWEAVNTAAPFLSQNYNGWLVSDGVSRLLHVRWSGSGTAYTPFLSTNDGTSFTGTSTVALGGTSIDEWPNPVYFNNRFWLYGVGTATDSIIRAFGSPDGTTWTNYGTCGYNGSGTAFYGARNVVANGAIYSFGGFYIPPGTATYTNQQKAMVSYNGARFYDLSTDIGVRASFLGFVSRHPMVANIGVNRFYFGARTGTGSSTSYPPTSATQVRATLNFSGTSVLGTEGTSFDPGQYDFAQNYARTKLYMKNAYKLCEYDIGLGTTTQVTDADYPAQTVRGIPVLDDYAFVMDPDGNIYNSAEGNYASWAATDFIAAQFENDGGVALTKVGGNIVALGAYTAEQFFNAGNATGSPLAPVQATPLAVGCVAADTVQSIEDTVYFVAQVRANQQGVLPQRFIARLVGNSYEKISQADQDRILAQANTLQMSAFISKQGGHTFYVLRLADLGFSLVFDTEQGRWQVWTARDQTSTAAMSNVVYANGTATSTGMSSVIEDGDAVVVTGYTGTMTPLNGTFNADVRVSGTVCWPYGTRTDGTSTTSQTGTMTHYAERAYPFVNAVGFNGTQVMQHADDGYLYYVDESTFVDDTDKPIDFRIRTQRVNGGTTKNKFWAYFEAMTDQVSGTALLRYSDDDSQTWSPYQRRFMSYERQRFNRLGAGAYRAFEYRVNSPVLVRVRGMKAEVAGGSV